MVIATWNMSHAVKRDQRRRGLAWAHLAGLGVDVAIVQEGGLPISGAVSSIVGPSVKKMDWATAVVSYGPKVRELDQPVHPTWNRKLPFRIPDVARPGTLAIGVVDVPNERPIVAVSLYGMLGYADQSVLRAASDLLPLFESRLGDRIVLAGDLNIHTHSDKPSERRRAGPILDLLESFGLRDLVRQAKTNGILKQGNQESLEQCPCRRGDCSHVRTHRHRFHAAGRMANNDYLFATDELSRQLQWLTIHNGDDDSAWKHSDHAPMLASFGASA